MKPLTERETIFCTHVDGFKDTFPQSMLNEFKQYWTEPNKSGTKMRYELEKTWDLKRRLQRWANTTKGTNTGAIKPLLKPSNGKPLTEVEALDEALKAYQLHPSTFSAKSLEKWYHFMKREQLLRRFTKEEINDIQTKHGHDLDVCRGLCVMMTFDSFTMDTITFSHILKMRHGLQNKTNG